jgi:hypothetical protein
MTRNLRFVTTGCRVLLPLAGFHIIFIKIKEFNKAAADPPSSEKEGYGGTSEKAQHTWSM